VVEGPLVSRVVVIGAGIIGASVASSLARRGAEVTVLDPGPPREGSSAANAGHLVPSHIIPFASPGMVGAGLRSLARRDGAFAINPRLRRQLAPWLAQFAAASTEANVRRGAPALEWLLGTSMSEVDRLVASGVELDHARDGLIQVFTRPESLEGARHEAAHMRELGYPAEEMSLDDLYDAEPLVHDAAGAILLTRDGRLNPALLLEALLAEAVGLGAELRTATVTGIATGPTAVVTTEGPIPADQVVLAAGVWTPGLAATVPAADGWTPRLPILPAKGYSVTVTDVDAVPARPLLLMDQRLAVTPMGNGLRITGRFELTGPADRGIPAPRTDALLDGARAALTLPADARSTQPWSGLRPATPDGLPVIGRIAPGSPVVVASGHGMLGTTTGPGTGELVAAMVAGEALPLDVSPLSPERFGRLPRRVR
jgi:D-amino-acid dehydrogenase